MDQIQEKRGTTNLISFYLSHELAHFVIDNYLKEHGSSMTMKLKDRMRRLGIPENEMSDWDVTNRNLFDGLSDLWESFANELAYWIMAWMERLKQGFVINHWEDSEVKPKVEAHLRQLRGSLLGSIFAHNQEKLYPKLMFQLNRVIVDDIMDPLLLDVTNNVKLAFEKMAVPEPD